MISKALGLFQLANPCVTRDSSSLMISEALGHFGLRNPGVTRDSSSLMLSEALGLFRLANPCVTRDRLLDDFSGPRAVWAAESMRLPWQQFVDDFVALGLFQLANPCVTRDSSSLMISEALN